MSEEREEIGGLGTKGRREGREKLILTVDAGVFTIAKGNQKAQEVSELSREVRRVVEEPEDTPLLASSQRKERDCLRIRLHHQQS